MKYVKDCAHKLDSIMRTGKYKYQINFRTQTFLSNLVIILTNFFLRWHIKISKYMWFTMKKIWIYQNFRYKMPFFYYKGIKCKPWAEWRQRRMKQSQHTGYCSGNLFAPDNQTMGQPDNQTSRQPDKQTTKQTDNWTTGQPDNWTNGQLDFASFVFVILVWLCLDAHWCAQNPLYRLCSADLAMVLGGLRPLYLRVGWSDLQPSSNPLWPPGHLWLF